MKLVLTYDLMAQAKISYDGIRKLIEQKDYLRVAQVLWLITPLSAELIEDNDLDAAHKTQPHSD